MKKNTTFLNKLSLSYGIASIILLSSLSAKAASAAAMVTSIPIANAGFEDPIAAAPDCPKGYCTGAPTDWTETNSTPSGNAGVWNPTSAFSIFNTNHPPGLPVIFFIPNQAPQGNQVLFLNVTSTSGSASVYQTLSATLQHNTLYDLSFDVSTQRYPLYLANYEVDLFAGSTLLASINNNNSPAVTYRTFANESLYYISGNNYSALIGQPLTIQITATGIGGSGSAAPVPSDATAQANFDDFQLNTTEVPESSSNIGILALGILGLVALLKRNLK